jgi:hypothetical protein
LPHGFRSSVRLLCSFAMLGWAHALTAQNGVYHGRNRQLVAQVPRLDAVVTIDGELTEDAWQRAALLTGFSSYLPLDNRPAQDSTEVLMWYTATDVYFGVRAFETHGPVHATLAARDRIDSDDYVQLLIDPFNDRRRAFVFGVNPLGAQADGIRTDAGNAPTPRGQTFGGNPPVNIDLNPDFVFESKGRLTEYGYELEVRIPLKSIRFQGTNEQRWSFQALRYVQHSGYQQTWTPARRGSSAFLGQSGTLTGFHDLQRETVIELNPELTASVSGTPAIDGWRYKTSPDLGANVRWRIVPNVTLNATVRPDFSQVEADAAQVPGDTRFALFFPEKRPFFVDGSDQYDSPSSLIYTRRIVQPAVAAKVSGKFGRTNVALLSAVDDRAGSALGTEHPVYNLLRAKRDIFAQSTLGFTYTDRMEGDDYNRVASADARIVYGGMYALNLNAGGSITRSAGTTASAPLYDVTLTRTGLRYGALYTMSAVGDDFVAASGFVPRRDFVRTGLYQRVSFYPRESVVESWLIRGGWENLWDYNGFYRGESVRETKLQAENVINLRGGWLVSLTPVRESWVFTRETYAAYRVVRPADTVAFTPSPRTPTYVLLGRLTTPQYSLVTGRLSTILGRDVDFFETGTARRIDFTADADWRLSDQLRLTTSYLYSHYQRRRNGTTLSRANVPRLKLEYQLSRALFVRFVGQYDNRTRDALFDPRTEEPLAIVRNGVVERLGEQTVRDIRVDWLVSYVPTPGTVVFAGYGASLYEPEAFRFRDLERVRDGVFVKLSYLLRR